MAATAFDPDAPLGQRRAIIRRDGDGVEMVERPGDFGPDRGPTGPSPLYAPKAGPSRPTAASSRRPNSGCRSRGRRVQLLARRRRLVLFRRDLAARNSDWPEAYAILTIEANADVAPYHRPADGGAEARSAARLARRCGPRTRTAAALAIRKLQREAGPWCGANAKLAGILSGRRPSIDALTRLRLAASDRGSRC